MSTLRAGDREFHTLPTGHVLTAIASAAGAGIVRQYPNSGFDAVSSSATGTGGTITIGPFTGSVRLGVECSAGTVDWLAGEPAIVSDWSGSQTAAGQALVSTPGNPSQPITSEQMTLLAAQLFNTDGTAKRLSMSIAEFIGTAGSQFFTVPDGCTVIEMEGTGSGGGGGGGFASASGGGGGGGSAGQQMYRRPVKVSPGETLTINVAQGGAGGAAGSNGSNGSGASGSQTLVTGSVSGQILLLTTGGGGKAGAAALGGNGGDLSGGLFSGGAAAPAANTAGTGGNDVGGTSIPSHMVYGGIGAGGGTGCYSTGANISGGRGGRTNNLVINGTGGATGAVSGNGGGGGGASGFPDLTQATSASGGGGGADAVAGTAGVTYGAGGGGGGRNAAGGQGGAGMIRIYY